MRHLFRTVPAAEKPRNKNDGHTAIRQRIEITLERETVTVSQASVASIHEVLCCTCCQQMIQPTVSKCPVHRAWQPIAELIAKVAKPKTFPN